MTITPPDSGQANPGQLRSDYQSDAKMAHYFRSKIGQRISRIIVAADPDPIMASRYEYQAEILYIDGDEVMADIARLDFTAHGLQIGYLNYLGSVQIDMRQTNDLRTFWREVLAEVGRQHLGLLK